MNTYIESPDEWLPWISYISCQWYVNDKKSQEGAKPVERGMSPGGDYLYIENSGEQDSKTPGSKYYYCVVTSSVQGYTASVTSNFARIVVRRSDSQLRICSAVPARRRIHTSLRMLLITRNSMRQSHRERLLRAVTSVRKRTSHSRKTGSRSA